MTQPSWFPVAPECCGQCGASGFRVTWNSRRDGERDVLVKFTCEGCGYIVSKYGHEVMGVRDV